VQVYFDVGRPAQSRTADHHFPVEVGRPAQSGRWRGMVETDGAVAGWRSRGLPNAPGRCPHIRSLAARCFKQASDVEDAVQDVLLTVHMVRNAYDPNRPFGPWLVAIANRRIIDRLRRDTRRKACEVALSTDHETFAEPAANLPRETPDEVALAQAIERLPPDQRQTIRMLKLNEMSLKEAAAASGRSIPALKVATHRAIKSLRRMLKQQSNPP